MKHLLYTLLLGVFLTSCYRKIDLNEYRTTPKMVINSVVSPDTVVMASITRTWFYPDKKPYVNLPHAHVELYINNQYIETMQWKTLNNPRNPDQPDTLFLSNTIPAEGDRIKIVASTPEYGTVTAEDIIPKKVPIKNASHTIKKGNGVYQGTISDYFEIYYEVTFDEFPEKNNYYLAKITQIKTGYYGYYETEQRIISIYSLSESYFLYLLSLQKIAGSTLEGGLGNIGLAEPLRVYSNVEGGTGILGGNQHSETTITLNNPSKK